MTLGGDGSGLERANPRGRGGLQAGGWVFGFLLAAFGAAALYTFEGYLVFTGALPAPVVWLTIWGYLVWVTLTARAWYNRRARGGRFA